MLWLWSISICINNFWIFNSQHDLEDIVLIYAFQDSNTNLKYVWESIELPDKGQSAIEKGAHNKTLVLSNLVEGVYLWKVTVTSSNPAGYGATVSNVTVLPAARINTPPKARDENDTFWCV